MLPPKVHLATARIPDAFNGGYMKSEQQIVLRDAAVFALKLWLDGFKDIALAFVGLGAAAFDLFLGPGRGGYRFYRVLRYGEKVDAAIDLYGAKDGPKLERQSSRRAREDAGV